MVAIPGYANEISIGLAPHAPPELRSLLNKAIAGLSSAEINDILFGTLLTNQPFTLRRFISRNPMTAVIMLSLVVAVVIAALLVVIWYRERALRRIREQLYVDALTGQWSIQRFKLEAERALCADPEAARAIVYIDIKTFKYINDVHGYDAGDLVLRAIGGHLAGKAEKGEMTARITADNFVMMLKTTGDEQRTKARAQRLLESLPSLPALRPYHLSFNAGLYFRADGETDIASMIDRANYARGVAKRAAMPNMLAPYDASIRESLRQEKELEGMMRTALKRGEFVPYFQPKVDIFSGRMVGAEALARWSHPDQGFIGPDKFIPLSEKNGFVVEIDFHIYERVCALMKQWLAGPLEPLPISCNFSRLHINDEKFHDRLEDIAASYGVPCKFLELEITETVAMENTDSLVKLMRQLQEKGFRIAIDDFGTGYSSLGLLQKLPADVLKLDHTFVDAFVERSDRVIIEGVVKIAGGLNMNVVCEGVETLEQVEFLKSVNCRFAQGYFYGRPMEAPEFERYWAMTNKREKRPWPKFEKPPAGVIKKL
ncbi:MAG: bifunctional diguanylate cyclase/phosphodiesterase [Candidatus Adiutrix sp.]|nr:bifunctional diguanylate cyclase/phosphodiesterase [Candidatus Adiutrix sp.]